MLVYQRVMDINENWEYFLGRSNFFITLSSAQWKYHEDIMI